LEDIFSKRKTLRTIKADTSDYFIPLFHTLAVFLSTKETIITKRFLEHIMKNLIALTLLLGGSTLLCAQKPAKTPATYKPVKSEMYRKGWIDFNKNGVKDVYEDPSAPLEARIENLLQQMTLDEKTCQMVTLYGYKRVLKDDLPTPEWKELLWKDGIGAIDEHLNGFQQWGLPPSDNAYVWPASRHAWALNEVQRFFVEDTRLGIPVDFTNEGIRGVESYRATNFPTQLGLGHTWNRELIRQVGLITGREARMLGYTNVYAPILDVGRDQRWGRYEEVYGESPYLVAELGIEMVRGLQHNHQVAATGKHFAAYSNNKGAREGMARVDPQMSPREVENIHIYPFKRVIREAGMLGVMSSYNDYDGIPVQGSYYWLTTRLRGEMGFRGYVVSDSDAVEYLYTKHGTAKDMKEAVRQSVEAGLNVRCTFRSPDSFVLPLRELVKEGGLSEEVINDRVRDILRVKFLIGLFDAPYQTDLAGADREVEKEENEAIALQASHESVVLLKNADELLPLDINSTKKIAVCGPNANEEGYALTHYGPLAVEVTTVLEGIQEKTKGKAEVLYTKGCDLVDAHWPESEIIDYPLTDDEQAEIDKAVENARQADVAVVVLGGGQRTCGENKSRTSLDLPGRQLQLLQAIQATGKPVVLILINGRPLSINWADKFVPAILEAWYPGSKGGTALADILFGDYNPGGKLTVTFPKTVGQIPFNFPCKPSSQIDGGKNPGPTGNMSRINGALYPFGYGLSYTTFEYSDLDITPRVITPNESATVRLKVTNTGKRAGDEVVQLYIRDVLSSITTYEKNLAGFQRIHLEPGEAQELSFTIDRKHLELLDADMKWVVEPGDFVLMAGASSEDIRLNGTLTVEDYQTRAKAIEAQKPAKRVSASTNPEDAENVLDEKINTAWQGNKGDYITFALKNGAKVDKVAIAFTRDNNLPATFEIQLSGGGGQFLTVYSGTVSEYGKLISYPFKGTTASDLRIVLNDDRVSIAEVKF
jgi:beta-glucosidase